jgi:hypothetical protein
LDRFGGLGQGLLEHYDPASVYIVRHHPNVFLLRLGMHWADKDKPKRKFEDKGEKTWAL